MNKLHANEFLKIEILAEEFINRINETGIPLFAFIELISLLAASSLKIHNEVNFKEFDKDFISLCKKYNNICTCEDFNNEETSYNEYKKKE